MVFFSRLGDIISSNINAMLDKAENPEKMVKMIIQEMEDTLVEIKANCAGAMAVEKQIQRDMASAAALGRAWGDKANAGCGPGTSRPCPGGFDRKAASHRTRGSAGTGTAGSPRGGCPISGRHSSTGGETGRRP